MAAKNWTGSIATDTDTNIATGLTVGLHYALTITYPSGVTGTVTPKELGADDTTYRPFTKDGAAFTITATTDTGIVFQCMSSTLRLTTASLAGGSVYYKLVEIQHGH